MSLTPSLDPDPESDLDPDLDPESDLAAPGRPTPVTQTLMRQNKQIKVNFHSSVNQNIKQEKQTNKSEFSFICQSCSRV